MSPGSLHTSTRGKVCVGGSRGFGCVEGHWDLERLDPRGWQGSDLCGGHMPGSSPGQGSCPSKESRSGDKSAPLKRTPLRMEGGASPGGGRRDGPRCGSRY